MSRIYPRHAWVRSRIQAWSRFASRNFSLLLNVCLLEKNPSQQFAFLMSTTNSKHLIIDGETMEGGGQVIRNSISLAALLGIPLRIINVRGKRDRPGMSPICCNLNTAPTKSCKLTFCICSQNGRVASPASDWNQARRGYVFSKIIWCRNSI